MEPECTVVAARSAAREALGEIRDRLIGLGLVVADGQAWATRFASSAAVLAVLALGMMKISVGMTRHRPVGFLVILCAMTAVIGLALLVVRPHRSRYGDRELDRLRRENAALRTATGSRADELTGADLAPGAGLVRHGRPGGGAARRPTDRALAAARVVRRLWGW